MKILKAYVKNPRRPEASIVERYVAEEAVEFCNEYLSQSKSVGIPSARHKGKGSGKESVGGQLKSVDREEMIQAHTYFLNNTPEVHPYIVAHKSLVKRQNPRKPERWLVQEHNKKFLTWFKNQVLKDDTASETITWLADGPNFDVRCWRGYDINGSLFGLATDHAYADISFESASFEQYDVPDKKKLRTRVFSRVGDAWRAFKTKLTREYVFGEKIGVLPYDDIYPFLDADTWKAFVASRQTPEFLEIRKKAQESQSYNLSPHILSRGGYDLLMQKIMDEKYRARKEASTDPSEIIPPPSPSSRHELWKRARITKKGDYVSKEAKIVADKIDSLEEQCTQGSFKPVGRNDILATALGKPEHPGRVRGVGKGVGIKDFFGPLSCSSVGKDMVSRDEMETIISRRIDEVKDEWKKEMMMMIGKGSSIDHSPDSPRIQSTTESCVPNVLSLDELSEDKECELYVDNPQKILVAYGRIHNLRPTIHHKKMNKDEVRVVVLRVIVGDALVPYPTEEVTTVEEAPNNFITWPRRLVKGANAKVILT
ncbi:Unknown protein [Striga hermonthica]|uniref:DUF8039 domain-containing protein n=1 Tax=Striga hermonthica TaxID=68872 RepID=A0A9N7N9S0_STRHE|nr:Unknown protein [Striga hermonthica]